MNNVLIATQLLIRNGNQKSYTEPVYHHGIPKDQAIKYCQFLANAVGTEVRLTYPATEGEDVIKLNGTFIRNKIELPLGKAPIQ